MGVNYLLQGKPHELGVNVKVDAGNLSKIDLSSNTLKIFIPVICPKVSPFEYIGSLQFTADNI